jgi:hypothetical protein
MTCFARCIRLGPTVLVCSALIASTACVTSGRAIGGDPFQGSSAGSRSGSRSGELRIQVRNSNFNEGTVYAVRSGSLRRRLGRVQGVSDGDFRMPLASSDQIHFEIDLLASQTCVTRRVFVEPGQTLLLVIDSTSRPRSDGRSSMCDVR